MTEDPDNLFKMDRVECEKCGAVWLNGEHYWRTGVKGSEFDLAGLVCNKLGDEKCINQAKGSDASVKYGDSWDKRLDTITTGFHEKYREMDDRFNGEGEGF